LRHTPPLFGKFSFTYSNKKHQIGYFISYNGKKQLKNFSVSELNKLYLYTDSGSPSWITHNFFYKFNYNYFINFDFGIDNIFDIHYRTYSSGISAPGRNIRLGLNLKF
jgi:hemoglobin/transferrin/lactoferrin receptor protein